MLNLCKCGAGIACVAGVAAGLVSVGFMAGRTAPAPAGSAIAVAQPEGMDPEAMMKLWEEKNRTGAQHEFLAKSAGTWDAEVKMWMDPSAPPDISQGSEKNSMIFDGRYLKGEFTGDWMGEKFEGISFVAYNNTEERFESIWIDSTGTALMFSTGEKQGNDTLVFTGEMKDCMSEQMMSYRNVLKFESPDKRVMTMHHTMAGMPEMKVMEITYTRRGAGRGVSNDGNRANN